MPKLNDQVSVTCYGTTETLTRQEAIAKYSEGMAACDPGSSEYSRYANIVQQAIYGVTNIKDDP